MGQLFGGKHCKIRVECGLINDITRYSTDEAFTPNLAQSRCKIPWLRPLLFWGLIELDMSNEIYFQNPVYLHHFCVFEIFVRPMKTAPHSKWLRTYMFAHKVLSWSVEQSSCIFSVTIAGFPVLDSAIGNGFLNVSIGFRQIIHRVQHKAYDITHHITGFRQTVIPRRRRWHGSI